MILMDDQQQRRVDEAAQEFAEAVTESFRAVSDRAVSTQRLNAELTQNFFNSVIESLRRSAEQNRKASQEFAEQTQRGQEATQTLTQESVSAYMDFMSSMFSFYQGNLQVAERDTAQTGQSAGEASDVSNQEIREAIEETHRRSEEGATGQAEDAEGGGARQAEDENRQAIRETIEEVNRRSGL